MDIMKSSIMNINDNFDNTPQRCSAYFNGYCALSKVKYEYGQPCEHKGCLNHISHPCEVCGRIGGKGVVYEERCDLCYSEIKNKY